MTDDYQEEQEPREEARRWPRYAVLVVASVRMLELIACRQQDDTSGEAVDLEDPDIAEGMALIPGGMYGEIDLGFTDRGVSSGNGRPTGTARTAKAKRILRPQHRASAYSAGVASSVTTPTATATGSRHEVILRPRPRSSTSAFAVPKIFLSRGASSGGAARS